jgi:hypothetical protein
VMAQTSRRLRPNFPAFGQHDVSASMFYRYATRNSSWVVFELGLQVSAPAKLFQGELLWH